MLQSELRVGNIVQHLATNNYYAEINAIFRYDNIIRLTDNPHGYAFDAKIGELTPIKISKEVLEMCGIELRKHTEDGEIYGIENFTIIYALATDGQRHFFLNGYHNDCQIDYLHHLQNVFFALRNVELPVNLK